MPYYIHHRNGRPISLNSYRLHANDLEITDELGEQFISTERLLSDFNIEDAEIVHFTDTVMLGDRVLEALRYCSVVASEQSLIISPNHESGGIEFFTKDEVIAAVNPKEFQFLVDGKLHHIDLAEFIEGQYTLYTEFTKQSTFAVERIVERIFLYRGYGEYYYRRRNRVRPARRLPTGGLNIKSEANNPIYVTDTHNPNLILRIIEAGETARITAGEVGYINGVRIREL